MCVKGRPCWRCPQGERPNLSDQENGIFRGKHRSALDQREHDTQIKLLAGIILCAFVTECVCECVWMNRWRLLEDKEKKKPDLSGAVKSSRWWRQETSPSGGREWLWSELFRMGLRFCRGGWWWGSTRGWRGWCLGLMPRDKSYEAFTGGWAFLLLPPFLFSFNFSWSAAGPALLTHCLSLIPTLSSCRSACVSAAAGLDR